MEYTDYLLLKKGFSNRRIYDQRVLRKVVTTVIAPWLKDIPNQYGIWPLPKDDELKKEEKERSVHISEHSLAILKAFRDKEQSQKSKEN